jgi:hypothetical protein
MKILIEMRPQGFPFLELYLRLLIILNFKR